MKRRCHAVGMMLLMAAEGMCAQTAGPKSPKAPPPPRNVVRPGAARSSAGQNPAAPKAGGAPRLGNPGNPVERLMAMPPEKREQVLEKLPPQQQANLDRKSTRLNSSHL